MPVHYLQSPLSAINSFLDKVDNNMKGLYKPSCNHLTFHTGAGSSGANTATCRDSCFTSYAIPRLLAVSRDIPANPAPIPEGAFLAVKFVAPAFGGGPSCDCGCEAGGLIAAVGILTLEEESES